MKKNIQIDSRFPCPGCTSSNAAFLYEHPTEHYQFIKCYSCDKTFGVNASKTKGVTPIKQKVPVDPYKEAQESPVVTFEYIPGDDFRGRGIKESVYEFYGVRCTEDDSKASLPYYDKEGILVASKVSIPKDAGSVPFYWTGDATRATLFGRNLFKNTSRNMVTVTEGEWDAMAAYQMFDERWAYVSIKGGAAAAKNLSKDDHEWLSSFGTIVICFDNDAAGLKAREEFAQSFDPTKVKIMDMVYKDANEYLKAGKKEAFKKAWWDAKPYRRDDIVFSNDLLGRATLDPPKPIAYYPFKGLNDALWGLYPGQLIVLTAGSGSGKTSLAKRFMLHLFDTIKDRLGNMILEESVDEASFNYISMYMETNLNKPQIYIDTPKDRIAEIESKLYKDNRFLFWNHFGSADITKVCDTVRYFAHNCGAKAVLLDHISIVVSSGENGDERKSLDSVMTRLRSLCEETGVILFVISHLTRSDGTPYEEGGITSLSKLRGSGAIGQLSDACIGLERNGQAEDPYMRNVSVVRALKARKSGNLGPCCRIYWDQKKATFIELDNEDWKEHLERIKAADLVQSMKPDEGISEI